MIKIEDKSKCCGCTACYSVCPKNCISLKEDKEGFLYPAVDYTNCIGCGLCEKVCPVINQNEARTPLKTYAAYNINERIRMQSSSGGVFTLLAESVIGQGGVVFGARFNDDWEVIHDYTETIDGIGAFRGSKYVQSNIGDNFTKVKSFLESGRKVLFSGTPCQVSGLKKYLRKDYKNLLTVDFICHGVPSPKVWKKYLNEISESGNSDIKYISFRDKSSGWNKFSFVSVSSSVRSKIFYEDAYMQAFLSNLSLRPSCYACHAKCGKSGSDLTLGDCWGMDNIIADIDDDKGCSILLINNMAVLPSVSELALLDIKYGDVIVGNYCLVNSVNAPVNRKLFFFLLNAKIKIKDIIRYLGSQALLVRIIRRANRKLVDIL